MSITHEEALDLAIKENLEVFNEVKKTYMKATNFLMGQVMKKMPSAHPLKARHEILRQLIEL